MSMFLAGAMRGRVIHNIGGPAPAGIAYHAELPSRNGGVTAVAKRNSSKYEHISQPVAKLPLYLRRQARSLGIGLLLIAIALYLGMLGYHKFVGLSWIDSYENAAMILSGMGPVANPTTFAGKLFSGTYALFSGIAVLAIAAVITAPLVHRFLHRLHADPGGSR
jgi:hypothetical protein